MIVCHCFGITDKDLRRMSAGSVSSEGSSKPACAGQGCGGCLPLVRQVLAQNQAKEQHPRSDDRPRG